MCGAEKLAEVVAVPEEMVMVAAAQVEGLEKGLRVVAALEACSERFLAMLQAHSEEISAR